MFSKKTLIAAVVFIALIYGLGRLYYELTAGFTIAKISSDIPYDPRWETAPLTTQESADLHAILKQKFTYLGRGCQSYVFESEDHKYVIKFIKYYHFRPAGWLDYIAFLPPVEKYHLQKTAEKRRLLETLFSSWKLAYEELQPETGVVYVHMNKSKDLKALLKLYDKMGVLHLLNLDEFEFMVQRKVPMLGPVLEDKMARGEVEEAKKVIDALMATLLSEYARGYADNDHALMQNTGVFEGHPIHIDVGQFVRNQSVKEHVVYDQELFNKTWRFRKWLEENYPLLSNHLVEHLKKIIGNEKLAELRPHLNKKTSRVLLLHDF